MDFGKYLESYRVFPVEEGFYEILKDCSDVEKIYNTVKQIYEISIKEGYIKNLDEEEEQVDEEDNFI